MDIHSIEEFFDHCAKTWDDEMIRNDEVINLILENAEVTEGNSVLDVACGTGVLIPDYIKRNVSSITGIDISKEMIKIAEKKYSQENITFICENVEQYSPEEKYDNIMIYNAFPHFLHPEKLIQNLSKLLNENGTLCVAHGMSRKKIDEHHSGAAKHVSNGLMDENELADIFSRYLTVTVKISNDKMYQVVGKKQ